MHFIVVSASLTRRCVPPMFGYTAYWIAGQRQNRTSCSTPFVWKPYSGQNVAMSFNNGWFSGQPDCSVFLASLDVSSTQRTIETCMHYIVVQSLALVWNDVTCTRSSCVLCELDTF